MAVTERATDLYTIYIIPIHDLHYTFTLCMIYTIQINYLYCGTTEGMAAIMVVTGRAADLHMIYTCICLVDRFEPLFATRRNREMKHNTELLI